MTTTGMTKITPIVVLVLLVPRISLALTISMNRPPPPYEIHSDSIHDEARKAALPGTPVIPQQKGKSSSKDFEWWRKMLGERLLKAANAQEAMNGCGSFLATDTYVFCHRAMPNENFPEFRKTYRGIKKYVVNETLANNTHIPQHHNFLGLSFGIGRSDTWSELMSSMYLMKTKLFDCDYVGPKGPIANDWHTGFSVDEPCTNRACYTMPYTTQKTCLGKIGNSKLLNQALAGRGPLSTFVRINVEGREWNPLEQLLKSEKDIGKIRTLDLEVHLTRMNETSKEHVALSRLALIRNVEILEGLAEKFAVTGSNLGSLLQSLIEQQNQEQKISEGVPTLIQDTVAVCTNSSINFNTYSISFVNRKLLF